MTSARIKANKTAIIFLPIYDFNKDSVFVTWYQNISNAGNIQDKKHNEENNDNANAASIAVSRAEYLCVLLSLTSDKFRD